MEKPKRKKQEEEENQERWLLTYADMITLLMAFFILMYTMSRVDTRKMAAISADLKERLEGHGSLFGGSNIPFSFSIFETQGEKGSSLIGGTPNMTRKAFQLKLKDISTTLRRNKFLDTMRLRMSNKGLVVTLLTEGIFFDLKSAKLKPKAKEALDLLGPILEATQNDISIEGHSDEQKFSNERIPSINWNLSISRALAVLNYLVQKKYVDEKRVSLSAFSFLRPTKYSGLSEVEKQQLNRRVDIVILGDSPKFTRSETTVGEIQKEIDFGW